MLPAFIEDRLRPARRTLPRLLAPALLPLALLQAGSAPAEVPRPVAATERECRAGETHSFEYDLKAGDFLGIVVEQIGIDLVLELYDPRGEKVLTVDSNDFWLWEEEIAWVAEFSGSHRLVVTPWSELEMAGRFRLAVDGPRPPRERDLVRRSALAELALAQQASRENQHEARLVHLERSLQLGEDLDGRRRAQILHQMGTSLTQLGKLDEAAARLHEAADLLERLGLTEHRHWALLAAAWPPDAKMGREEEARRHLTEAAQVARRDGLDKLEIRSEYTLGRLHEQQPRIARRHFQAAFDAAQRIGERREQLYALFRLAYTVEDLAEPQEALQLYQEALERARELRLIDQEESTLNNMGFLYFSLGDEKRAVECLEQALKLARQLRDAEREASVSNNLALIFVRQESFPQARALYERTIALGRSLRRAETESVAMNNLAFLELRAGNPALALEHSRTALRLAAGDKLLENPVRQALGTAYRKLGDLDASRRELEAALALSRERGDRVRESQVIPELARTEVAAGNLARALDLLEEGIRIVESLRAKVVTEELRSTFLGSRQGLYELHVDTLMALHRVHSERGYDAQALQASERARARTLLDTLAEGGADILEGAAPRLIEEERRLRAEIETLEGKRLARLHQGDAVAAAEATARLTALLEEQSRLRTEIRVSSPHYAALTQPEPLSLSAIQREVLGPGTLLLEYSLGEERSFLWAVSPDRLQSFELPPRKIIEDAARRYYAAVTRSPEGEGGAAALAEARQAAGELSGMLLQPIAPLLVDQTLLFVADGALQYIPFGALPGPSALAGGERPPLLEQHEVVSLPSASVLAVLRRELAGRAAAPRALAVLADPIFHRRDPRVSQALAAAETEGPRGAAGELRADQLDPGKLPRLRFSAREAEAIAGLVPPNQRLNALGFAASRDTALGGELAHYRIVHFATHGLIDSRRPELSSLVLSLVDEQGKPQNGFLRLYDIYNLELNADLVVLSACQTALGQEIRGEGLIGLTRGFMYAGAARVLASLWSVDDRATSELMQLFYRHMISEGLSPAEALRRAQMEMSRHPRWSAPYYWAGFSLQGEWR